MYCFLLDLTTKMYRIAKDGSISLVTILSKANCVCRKDFMTYTYIYNYIITN